MSCLETKRVCPHCGQPMIIDDVDYTSDGYYDRLLACYQCGYQIKEYFRYGQLWKEEHINQNGLTTKVVKYKLKSNNRR